MTELNPFGTKHNADELREGEIKLTLPALSVFEDIRDKSGTLDAEKLTNAIGVGGSKTIEAAIRAHGAKFGLLDTLYGLGASEYRKKCETQYYVLWRTYRFTARQRNTAYEEIPIMTLTLVGGVEVSIVIFLIVLLAWMALK